MQQPIQLPQQSLDKCAEERIHIPGAIQSHGVLLAVTLDALSIVQASESSLTIFGIECEQLIGQPIKIIIGEEQQSDLTRQLANDKLPLDSLQLILRAPVNNKLFEATIHRSGGLLIVELEEAANLEQNQSLDFFRTNDQAIAQVLECTVLPELLQAAAESVRALTGFDRTMIYLFDSDWNGTVLAECKSAEDKSYLGLRFPASDIPVQARELYKRNRLRTLVNVEGAPSSIRPPNNPITLRPLDLSDSILRAMSPVHVEYLKNMGVAASMSISLISQGELRGLIACHHYSAKHVDRHVRRACDFLARLVSLQSDAIQERETFKKIELLKDARKDLLLHVSLQDALPSAIASSGSILNVVGAKGAAVIWDEQYFAVGLIPGQQQIAELVDYLHKTSLPVFVTDSLSKYVPFAASMTAAASGLLAIRLALNGSKWLLWFRPEQLEEVSWAGKQDDSVEPDSTRLHPRKSFELWKENVSGKSLTWLGCEVQSALELRTVLLDISLSMSEKARAAALEEQVAQLDSLSLELLEARHATHTSRDESVDMFVSGGPNPVDENRSLATPHCVLVIENSDDDFGLKVRQLEDYNDTEVKFEHGDSLAAAFARLEHGGIDVIFLDLSLSESSDIDAVPNAHLLASKVPIVVLCSSADISNASEVLKYGAEDYFLKDNIDFASLNRSINYALARHTARVANEKLATIVEDSEHAIIGKTLEGIITGWNKAASKLFGYSKEEAIGKSISMLIPPESSLELDGILKTITSGASIHNFETVRINKEGQRVDILATITPVVKGDGTIIGVAAIDRDNTERKHAQKVLQESEERYRVLVGRVKDYATFMLDVNGFIETWNDGARRLKGYEAAEIVGKHFSVFYTPEEQERKLPDAHLKTALERGCFEESGWRIRNDGSRFFAEIVIVPRFSAAHEIQGFTKITRDVTDRVLAEREIADSRLRLTLALEAAAVGVWDFDLINNSVWRSLRHDEIFGHKELLQEWNFDVFASFVIQEDQALAKDAFQTGLKLGQFKLECRIKRAGDNAIRWIAARGKTFWNEHGVAVRMLGTIADFTDVKEQQEQQRLLAIMNEREDFMATLTHDMKNPLIGANRLLELFIAGSFGQITSQQSEIFLCLKESNSALLKLIADLIDVYRLEKDVSDLSMADCDLVCAINACVSRIIPFAKLRSVEVTTQLPARMLVQADSDRIERVVQNLLDNALKFTPDGGTIHVRLLSVDANVVIEVEDNGPGIALDEQSRLFKRFSQGAAGKRYTGGNGLGLYLSKQIVEAHGGTIECQSQPRKMTIFRVSLPQAN